MRRRENINERQSGLHASGDGCVFGAAQQRIQPDQSAGTSFYSRKRRNKLFRFTSVPAVTQDDHDSTFVDRKSTRLNSSHSQISYAVFCLKKKIKKKQ